jgi:predicted ABC-type ATPase
VKRPKALDPSKALPLPAVNEVLAAPTTDEVLANAQASRPKPVAFVVAGHNGAGKSTLWYELLASKLQMPLVNADRLTMSILPDVNPLPDWARDLRDNDARWQTLSQEGVQLFRRLIMDQKIPFAYETVFSYWKPKAGGGHASKVDDIIQMQKAGYFVILLFVGLANVDLSILRVLSRKSKGGHDVPIDKLLERYPRTQAAIKHATGIADMTLMFDNSRTQEQAFALVRAQKKNRVLYDIRSETYKSDSSLRATASLWLSKVS